MPDASKTETRTKLPEVERLTEGPGLLETMLATMERMRDMLRLNQSTVEMLVKRIEALEAQQSDENVKKN